MKNHVFALIKVFLVLVLLNIVASYAYRRFDLTEDKRYTISDATKELVEKVASPIIIDVLLEGEMPAEFTKLQDETALLLGTFSNLNDNISYDFVNPIEDNSVRDATIAELQQIGLTPASVTIEEDGKISQEVVFPWAIVSNQNKTVQVPLLKNKLGSSSEERINNSVQQLEYAFADAITKLTLKDKKRIAVLKGNGELADRYLADFLSTIREYYNIGAFTLDSLGSNPQKTFDALKTFDLIFIAKPTEPFTDEEKYVLDQYMVSGGKSVWLLDKVSMELDSLMNEKGSAIAVQRNLNLNDLLFKYGIRINPVLVKDLYNTPIVLAAGEANDSQYNPLPWVYHPMVFSKNNHPINKNIEASRFQFANVIDTLQNDYDKTVLLQSSPLSKFEGVPNGISLAGINTNTNKENFVGQGDLPLAVLVEGEFQSAYNNRVKPLALENSVASGPENQLLVIADGDLVKNQMRRGQPLPLGYDKWTNNTYGNKEFLVNSVNYLLDDTGLINIRNKEVAIPLLDVEKIAEQKTKWQLINIAVPVVFVFLIAFVFKKVRERSIRQ